MQFKVLHFKTLDSTNNHALKLAKDGAAEGAVVCADYQTAGRGRQDHEWKSSRGAGLLFSIIIRPKIKSNVAPMLTLIAAEAIVRILDHIGLKATIKKPNDVLVDGKKIAGILTESAAAGSAIEFVVIGIGLNVNAKKSLMLDTATSILEETKKEHKNSDLLELYLREFSVLYSKWLKGSQ